MENEKVQLTREGYDKLKSELRHLIDVIRPEVIDQLAYARSLGDLSENADYSIATALPAGRPSTRLLLGGPGWDVERCAGATFVTGLPEACEMVSSTLGLAV
jgi:hypothetical protein